MKRQLRARRKPSSNAPFTVEYLHSIFEIRGNLLFHRINRGVARAGTLAGSLYPTPPHWIVKIHGERFSQRRIIYYMTTGLWVEKVPGGFAALSTKKVG